MDYEVNFFKFLQSEEVVEMTNSLDKKEFDEAIRGFRETVYWRAMIKYIQDRIEVARDSLLTINPYKDPEKMSKIQGVIDGLGDFAIFVELKIKEAKENSKTNKREE